ncbi:hypothetical protein [Actinokineospora globicatena]|uniref:Uncharacterized protein n=1 Tax=Actinokineospora globicatena TaxID=103729 RepID=A0A9W6QVH4_9PSEU|nr:hypothetical protein [Actinokineospora globicatena]GLW95878.1 hypothetical protein Aglo03_66940 [Actinokineospora globicatena]
MISGPRDATATASDHHGVPATAESPVPAPTTAVPATGDPTTAILHWLLSRRYRSTTTTSAVWATVIAATLFALAMSLLTDAENPSLPLVAAVCNGLVLLGYLLPGGNYLWLRSGLDQVRTRGWRTVRARVLRAGRWTALVEVVDDSADPLVLSVRIDPAHLAMITDTAYLIRGRGRWAVLRVPGSRELFPAKVKRSGGDTSTVDLSTVDVTVRWAKSRRDAIFWLFGQLAVFLVAVLVVVAITMPSQYLLVWWLVLVLVTGGGLAIGLRFRLPDVTLPQLVRAGEWVRAGAALSAWTARRDSTASATATLRFADGIVRTVVMPAAPVDLLAAITDSSSLWVNGSGSRVAVGFPGYPLLAVART